MVGDFNGDHVADLFLATGDDWFVALGGRSWQPFVLGMTWRTPDLRLGDFTGDGRTDVFGVNGNEWVIVPADVPTRRSLRSALTQTVDRLVVADFDGDGIADVARNSKTLFGTAIWEWSKSGTAAFTTLRSDTNDLTRLPIGNFDLAGGADVIEWSTGDTFAIAPGPSAPRAAWSRHPMR